MNNAYIKKLTNDATIPTRGSNIAAGFDLYACFDNKDRTIIIRPGSCEKIGTGIAITPPEGYFGAVFARSGLACKRGLRPSNCVG